MWSHFVILLILLQLAGAREINPDLFAGSRLALDASFGLRPKSENDTGGQALRVLPLTPGDLLRDRENVINRLFERAANTHSYLWARWDADDVSAAALAHIKYCAVEQNQTGWRRPHRRTFCSTRVKGSETDIENKICGDKENVTTIPLIEPFTEDSDSTVQVAGTESCFRQGVCSGQGDGQFNSSNLRTFVVLAEQPSNATQSVPLTEYLSQTREGKDWFQENLVRRESPFRKSIFPNVTATFGGSGTSGTVLVSYRQGQILGDACADDPGSIQRDIDEVVQARTSEELGIALTRAVHGGVSWRPAEPTELVLIIVASFIAMFGANASWYIQSVVLVKTDEETGDQVVDSSALEQPGARRGPNPLLYAMATLLKVALELLPIFFLLAFEIRARDQVDITSFEVIGTGVDANIPGAEEQYSELTTGLVVVAIKNTSNNIVVVSIFCGVLTIIALCLAGWEFYYFGRKRKIR